MVNKDSTVAVLLGGISGEREVSRASGTAVVNALKSLGYHVVPVEYDPHHVIEQLRDAKADVVFLALHGRYGEDGTVQSVLELAGIPYTGSGVSSSAITMDKILSSRVFKEAGVRMSDSLPVYLRDGVEASAEKIRAHFDFPLVLKPACEGSSIGMEFVHKDEELDEALERAFKVEPRILVEAYLDGEEFTIPILNGKPMPIIKIVPHSGNYDFHSKYTKGATDYLCPAPIGEDLAEEIRKMAVKAYYAAECSGVVRFDVKTDANGVPYILEANSIPGMTATSLVPKSAAAAGIDFPHLCEIILKDAGNGKV